MFLRALSLMVEMRMGGNVNWRIVGGVDSFWELNGWDTNERCLLVGLCWC